MKYLNISILLTILMSMVGANTFANVLIDGIFYNFTQDGAIVTYKTYDDITHEYVSNNATGSIIIPDTVIYNGKKYSVVSIGDYAFQKCKKLTSVTFGNNITSIGKSAFYGCTDLIDITIPNSITSVGTSAFGGTAWYNNLPDGLIYIGKVAYAYKGKMPKNTNINIKEGTIEISDRAFYSLTNLASINIPNSVTSIGDYAFGYTCLKSVTIGTGVKSIGIHAFYYDNIYSNFPNYAPRKIIWLATNPPTGYENVKSNTNYVPNNLYNRISKKIYPLLSNMFEIDGVKYVPDNLNDGTCDAIDCTYNDSVEICIKSKSITYNGKKYSINNIGDYTFSGCTGLINLIIPNGIPNIGNYAFLDCTSLTSITIPNSVTSIGNSAFSGCSSLTSVEFHCKEIGSSWFSNCYSIKKILFGDEVTSIGNSAFSGCTGLTNVTFPNSVTRIGNSAFDGCTGLTNVTFPNSVTSIGNSAFNNCTGLTNITIPNSVTFIGSSAFNHCSGLTSVEFHCKEIGSSWFSNCYSIKNILFGDEVNSIGNSAFLGCSGLTSIIIPNSVTTIGEEAFYNTRLKSVIIGSGVISIGSNAFNNNNGHRPIKVIWLTNTPPNGYTNVNALVNYVANNSYGYIHKYPFLSSIFEVDGVKYVPVSPSERTCDAIDCAYNESTEKINIGKTLSYKGIDMTIKNVNEYAFCDNPFIKEVNLSFDGKLSDNAFHGCTNITNVIVQNAGNIGNYAFSGINTECTVIVNNKGTIGSNAFYNDTGLKTLEIGENVTDIASGAFSGCTNLETANLQNKGKIADYVFKNCSAMKTVTLGEGITSIGQYAFDGCKKLQSIVIPDSVTSLGSYAFNNCRSMTSVKMGTGIMEINNGTFSECNSLMDMQIGNNVATISTYAFSNCTALPKIEIPQSVTKIEDYVFRGCKSFKEVVIADRKHEDIDLTLGSNGSNPLFTDCPLDSVYIGRNISYSTSSSYGYSPFYRNTSLRSVTITDKETEISPNEFYGCTNLKNVSIGDGVEIIGDWAFSGCSSLDYFAFGSNVKTIGKEAFSDCTAMTRLISRAATPPTCGSQALDDINKWNCTLSVPTGAITSYQQAAQWKDFFFINDDVTGISKLTNTVASPNHIYDMNGRKLKEPSKGINIIGRKKVVVK